jgi:hypothetical protein
MKDASGAWNYDAGTHFAVTPRSWHVELGGLEVKDIGSTEPKAPLVKSGWHGFSSSHC